MIRVRQVKVPVEEAQKKNILPFLAKKLKVKPQEIVDYKIKKESIDARKKDDIYIIYELDVTTPREKELLRRHSSNDIDLVEEETYHFPEAGNQPLETGPVIVGSGPAGLFAAYVLAENGYQPIVIERGEKIEERIQTVTEFWNTGKMNPNSNVQFGEGGAGTFSDGKLNTLVKDKKARGKKVFETLIACGANDEILYQQKPHIGTDALRKIIQNMRKKILDLGGTFYYQTCLTDIEIKNQKLERIEINHTKWIPCHCLILAIGHSARDTYQMLYERNIQMEAKSFAIGVRVEHLQKTIDEAQFGKKYASILGPATYKLTHQTKEKRGVYSFCMCPGGYVVNASSEEHRLAINGMSNYQRESGNANSAIVVTVSPNDFGTHPLAGIEYQRKLEEKAYQKANGCIPIQLWGDFQKNQSSHTLGKVMPQTKGAYALTNVREILPSFVEEALLEAIPIFGKKIHGYDAEDTLIEGIESRTSSPVRLVRNEEGLSNIQGIYPCGEGAGYAGGITTAAIDGLQTAEKIAIKYEEPQKKTSFFE